MAGLIDEDGFENVGDWIVDGSAYMWTEVESGFAPYAGLKSGYTYGLPSPGTLTHPLAMQAGRWYRFDPYFAKVQGLARALAEIQITGLAGGTVTLQKTAAASRTWERWGPFYYKAASAGAITLKVGSGGSVWGWDEVSVEEVEVAVMLGELGRKALLLTLQNNLSAELAHIVSERGDSLALDAPSSWYGFERQAETPDDVECAVYRSPDGVTFPAWEEQFMGGMTGSRAGEIHSEVGLTVTVTHANRDNVLPSEMQDRSDRYAAAILRVFRDNKALGIAGDSTVFVIPDRVAISEVDVSKASPNISKVDRIEIAVRVVMTEGSNGETNVGGGVPPAAATETV